MNKAQMEGSGVGGGRTVEEAETKAEKTGQVQKLEDWLVGRKSCEQVGQGLWERNNTIQAAGSREKGSGGRSRSQGPCVLASWQSGGANGGSSDYCAKY